ncbi:MAG: hypothetical protein RL272_411 [Candidatus Parcubacteria bacterium]
MIVKTCEKCDAEMRLVPAGFSRAKNKPYPAFWSCDKRNGGCGATARAEGDAVETAAPGGESLRLIAMDAKLDQILALLQKN